jgi:glyoxylase-like metal-dependent hydrolase (beta-lactamase superfamily II)
MSGAPGLLGAVICKLFFHPDERNCAGQVALLWRPGRMLFAGDVCTNVMGLGDPVGFENLNDGRASQRRLASLSFDAAGFGHGAPIARDASTRFRDKWGAEEGRNKRAA